MKHQTFLDKMLKWVATAILITGTLVNSLGYYPMGPLILVLGGLVWVYISFRWKEPSLIVTNVVITAVGIAGLSYTALTVL